MERELFNTLEQSVKLHKKGVEPNTDFVYVWNCEETNLDWFDIKGDVDAQLQSLRDDDAKIEIAKEGQDIFAEYTQVICPAYKR